MLEAFDGVCLWSKAQERMEATLAEVKNAEDAITQLEVPENTGKPCPLVQTNTCCCLDFWDLTDSGQGS